MNNLMEHKIGFTLAEVLMTLAIIGVVASLTIPTLVNSANTSKYRTGAKEMYSTMKQAIEIAKADNGGSYTGIMPSDLVDQLKIVKVCGDGIDDGCISATDGYEPYGGGTPLSTAGLWRAEGYMVILNSGASVALFSFKTDCSNLTTQTGINLCGRFVFDVNGPAKPNQLGVDVFGAVLLRDSGLVPYGAENADFLNGGSGESCDADWAGSGDAGYGCMIKVLMNEDY